MPQVQLFPYLLVGVALSVSSAAAQVLSEDLKITPPDAMQSDDFSSEIAIDGPLMIVGSPGDDDSGERSGSAYLYDSSTGALVHKLTANNGSESDNFGMSVAISGSTVVVGSAYVDAVTGSSGAAYLFDTVTGEQIHQLFPEDPATGEQFGISVAISGEIVVVGKPLDNEAGGKAPAGAVYIFDASTGTQQHKILAPDPDIGRFGQRVAVSGTTVLVNAGGANNGLVYVFDAVTGQEQMRLERPGPQQTDFFGHAIAISGTTAVVGAYRDRAAPTRSDGAVFVFDTVSGDLITKFKADDGRDGDSFGRSVDINQGLIVVGADRRGGFDWTPLRAGAAFLYELETESLIRVFSASDGIRTGLLGESVAVSETIAVAGSKSASDGSNSGGAVYLISTCAADPAAPFGTLNLFDLTTFLDRLVDLEPASDLAAPFGVFNFFDLGEFLTQLNNGCP